MKLSTRARYGTRALLDLAMTGGNEPVQLKDIAERQSISLHYLEHIINPLTGAGILRSTRGARGGVQLILQPRDIRLGWIVRLLEGSIAPIECINNPETCPRSDVCAAHDLWSEVKEAVEKVLDSVTLQDLVDRQKIKDGHTEPMYYL